MIWQTLNARPLDPTDSREGEGHIPHIGTKARSRHISHALMRGPIELVFLSCYSRRRALNQDRNHSFLRCFANVGSKKYGVK